MFPWSTSKSHSETKQNDSNSDNDNDNTVPNIDNYPLHAAVFGRDADCLIEAIKKLPPFDPLLPDKTRPINALDHHGYTALHLCVFLSWSQGIDILISNGASVTVRSRSGWSAVQECISTSQRNILRKLFDRNMEEVREGIALRSPIIRQKLCEKDDFYLEIDWKFSSWIPFVSRFCPCDTFKIWKRGSDFRLDMSLVDFESFSWKRGHLSLVFIMNKTTSLAEFYVLNHIEKTKQVTNKQKELEESKNEADIKDNIEQLLQSELLSPQIFTNKIMIEKSKTWFGYDKTAEINGNKCILYELRNLIVFANKRDSHIPEEVKQQRALTKQLFQSKVDASKNGSNIDCDIECIDIDKYDDDDEMKTKSASTSLSALFGNVKSYQYPQYIAPNIDINEYFNIDKWKQHKRNKLKKTKIISELIENKKETFKINTAPTTMSTKSFKLNLSMTDNFGVSVEEILAILEAAAPQSKLAAKLKEFLEIKMPKGFPIQMELPLFHILKGTVTFQNFEHINPSDDIFHIPNDYVWVKKDDKI